MQHVPAKQWAIARSGKNESTCHSLPSFELLQLNFTLVVPSGVKKRIGPATKHLVTPKSTMTVGS